MSVSCRDYTTELVCFNDGTNSRQLIAHYEYAKGSSNSILLATRYTEADGVTVIDTTTGTVTPGECCKPTIQYFQKFYYDSTLDECTPIKEVITTLCDGTQTYQYLMEDGAGGFTDATTTIVGWDENNVFIQSCMQNCKKEIFATHQKYYITQNQEIPASYVAYWMGDILDNLLGTTGQDTTNSYIHNICGILNGNADSGVGTDLTPPFTGLTPGELFTDVSLLQAMTDIAVANMGLQSSDYIYAITNDNQPIWFLSPAAVAELANNTYLHPYTGDTDTPGIYIKFDVVTTAPYTSADVQLTSATGGGITCTPIQEIKEKDSCTGVETYRYVIEDGNGLLVDATTIITGFDEDNISDFCIESTVEEEILNNPITFLLAANSSFATTTDYLSVAYLVKGNNATITTAHNSATRILFNNESGEFKADDGKTLDNIITFTTGANSRVVINAITRV